MISAILPFVLSVVTVATPTPAPATTGAEPAIRVTLNHQTYNRGDRARVTVRVRDDGYVVVLHEDANGHVRVLFPVDPGDDNFLKSGQDYEIRGRGDRDAFQVTCFRQRHRVRGGAAGSVSHGRLRPQQSLGLRAPRR